MDAGVSTKFLTYAGAGVCPVENNYPTEWVSIASAAALGDATLGVSNLWDVTGTTDITSIASTVNPWIGRMVILRFADILTFTDGNNLKLAGNLVTTADDTITLVYGGTNWNEVSRSVN
jgi:hypothetical protein